jgi:carbon monoxide dehydrogenase subunit G
MPADPGGAPKPRRMLGDMGHRVERTIETTCGADAAFAFVADFSTTARWDPGIIAAKRLDDGPIGVGSRFELVSRFGRREQTIVYEITGFEPPSRVTLVGDGGSFRGTDVIAFEPRPGGGTRVRYQADLSLKGVAALALPFIRTRLDTMSDDAVAGLRSALDALA